MQPSLITVASDAQVLRPGGTQIQRQFYRRPGAQGTGVYCAMDENGNVEIIGGPGAGLPVNIETGTFSRTALQGSGNTVVATTGKVRMVWFIASGGGPAGSNGQDNGVGAASLTTGPTGADNGDLNNSINVAVGADGYTAKISAIGAVSGYTVTWVEVGNGLDTTVRWFAITQ